MTAAATSAPRRRSALYELSVASSKELLRNSKTLFGLLFMFFFFLVLIWGVHLGVNGNRDAPVVGVTGPQAARLVETLGDRGIEARIIDETDVTDDITARVSLTADAAVVRLGQPEPDWIPLADAVGSVGIADARIAVLDADGAPETDILRVNLATALVLGIMAIAFMGTSVSLVRLRQRGTLRLFGTTPVKRLAFIVAQQPVRLALAVAEVAVIVAIAWSQGYVEQLAVLRLGVTLLLGVGMLFSFAFLLAVRSTNEELVAQLCGLIPVVIILTAGTVFPIYGLPGWVQALFDALPTTWFLQAVSADIAGTEPFTSIYLLWAMMAAVGVGVSLLAARLFAWDQGDGR